MINKISLKIHKNNKSKGFYDSDKNIGEMLALIHSEVSEALEADRKGSYCNIDLEKLNQLQVEDDLEFKSNFKTLVKDNFEDELADIMIRVMDLAVFKGIDLENHIVLKMRYNSLRPYKHGKKY